MAERGGGTVIAVSSVGSLKATPGLGAYALTKAALNQMVRTLAAEWGRHHIRINAILPGLVKTDFARRLWEDPAAEEQVRTHFAMGRLGEPDDIGPAAVFLAARAGAWMTGQLLVIDGGNLIMN
jgi:NAD(P)-dependent dehydrogenase (short-subunit alcohol dehydrogenase family)